MPRQVPRGRPRAPAPPFGWTIQPAWSWADGDHPRLAVGTTDTTAQASRGLAALGVAELFDAILGADGVTHPKPHPEMVERLCAETGVDARETVVVGDAVAIS